MTGDPAPGPGPELGELPERLRQRLVLLVADALPATTPLPASLKRVAAFAPARRARLGGGAISDALADEDFRGRAGSQVAARVAASGDDLDVAAVAWLQRDADWREAVETVVRRLAEQADEQTRGGEELVRLRSQVESLQGELREQRAEARAGLAEVKAENAVLRRRLGETRAALRAAEAQLGEARAGLEDAARREAEAVARAEAETRRVQARLDEALAELSVSRRDARAGRDAATLRARYLLDTVVDAAAGLRRELALPAVEGAPGDAVEEGLGVAAGARPGSGQGSGPGSGPVGAAALEQLLSLPRSRLVVDGYNVTKLAWGGATLEAQRSRLLAALGPLVARTGAETTVVFDAAASTVRPVVPGPRGVKVVFSPVGVIADDVIRSLVAAEPQGRVVVVVSDDQEVARDVRRAGARAVPVAVLLEVLTR